MVGKFEQKVFCRFDIPEGRTPDSFRFRISFLWDGGVVEEYFTDDPDECDRLVRAAEEQAYSVLVEF